MKYPRERQGVLLLPLVAAAPWWCWQVVMKNDRITQLRRRHPLRRRATIIITILMKRSIFIRHRCLFLGGWWRLAFGTASAANDCAA